MLFSELIEWLAINYRSEGKNDTEWELLKRRSVDFLVLGLVNIGMTGGGSNLEYIVLAVTKVS